MPVVIQDKKIAIRDGWQEVRRVYGSSTSIILSDKEVIVIKDWKADLAAVRSIPGYCVIWSI